VHTQGAPAVDALMAYLLALLSVGGLQQPVLVGLAVHAELVPRLWYSFLRVRPCMHLTAQPEVSLNEAGLWSHDIGVLCSSAAQHQRQSKLDQRIRMFICACLSTDALVRTLNRIAFISGA